MKILITGGAGMIGSHVAESLLNQGHEILIIDDFETGKPYHVPKHNDVKFIEASITQAQWVDEFQPDVIVHAAASYKDPYDHARDLMTNAFGTLKLVHAAKRLGVRRFIYFQTSLCYGPNTPNYPFTEDYPINPSLNSYAITKTVGEQFIRMSGIDYVSFRLANVVGARNLAGPLPTFYKRINAGETCVITPTWRDFVYVKDLVKLVHKAVNGVGHGIYHFSSGTQIVIKDLFFAVTEAMGVFDAKYKLITRPEDDVKTLLLSSEKAVKDFGAVDVTDLKIIVKDAVDYYKLHGVEQAYTHLKMDTK